MSLIMLGFSSRQQDMLSSVLHVAAAGSGRNLLITVSICLAGTKCCVMGPLNLLSCSLQVQHMRAELQHVPWPLWAHRASSCGVQPTGVQVSV
jgi:hypothetical protein